MLSARTALYFLFVTYVIDDYHCIDREYNFLKNLNINRIYILLFNHLHHEGLKTNLKNIYFRLSLGLLNAINTYLSLKLRIE